MISPRRRASWLGVFLLSASLLGFPRAAEPAVAGGPTCAGKPATIVGTKRKDVLVGTKGRDVIVGRGGRDLIRGRGGNDLLCGGAGADLIYGNGGADALLGNGGNDGLFGGAGPDTLSGGPGPDGCLQQGGTGTKLSCAVVVAAAGDIACDPDSSSFNDGKGTAASCRQLATSKILRRTGLVAVLTLGDNQYEEGTLSQFRQSYAKSWGRLKGITRPAVGNHEYLTEDADGYFDYFGSRAGGRSRGYYSFKLDSWLVVVLNSSCSGAGGCDADSSQGRWLKRVLNRRSAECTLATWHEPRWSSGKNGNDDDVAPFWRILFDAEADLVLNGHDHIYERFAPQNPSGNAAPNRGIRQFTVGTGGKNHTGFPDVQPNSEKRHANTFGVLKLTLRNGSYSWRFVPEAGKTFTDSGSDTCHWTRAAVGPTASRLTVTLASGGEPTRG